MTQNFCNILKFNIILNLVIFAEWRQRCHKATLAICPELPCVCVRYVHQCLSPVWADTGASFRAPTSAASSPGELSAKPAESGAGLSKRRTRQRRCKERRGSEQEMAKNGASVWDNPSGRGVKMNQRRIKTERMWRREVWIPSQWGGSMATFPLHPL